MATDTLVRASSHKASAAVTAMDCQTLCPPGESSGMERTRFFPRQLVTPDDLTQDQLYFRDKELRHNRMLHGWGVVCGVRVMKHPTDTCKVVIESGYVLGPYGHEIVVDRYVEVDLCHEGPDGNAVSSCGSLSDPWCSDVRVNRTAGRPLYIAIKYSECESRPVRAQGHGCSCGESECEYSRIRDSFVIKVLRDLPTTYSDPMPRPDVADAIRCATDPSGRLPMARACPPCPTEPWVILADVTIADDGSVKEIDCFAHRRYVASFADFYFLCRPASYDATRPIDVIREKAGAVIATDAPPLMIAVTRADKSVAYLPVRYTVVPGETVGAFLAREGKRSYVDPATGDEFELGEVYAMAGADPAMPLASLSDATKVLEGVQLRVADFRDVRTRLQLILGEAGNASLAEDHAGAPAAVEKASAASLQGVVAKSAVAKKLAAMSVGDVAGTSRDAFIEQLATGVAANQQGAARTQAGAAWDSAAEALRLTSSWRRRPTG